MNITEMINRLTEIKNMHGDMPLLFWSKRWVTDIKHPDIICIGKGNSTKYETGIYFRMPEDEEDGRDYIISD